MHHTFLNDIQWLNRQALYQQFWTALLQRSQSKTTLFANIKPKPDYYIYTSAGKPGVSLGYVISVTDWASVDVYINLSTKERSKKLFDLLHAQKDDLEAAFGEPLEWMRLDNKRMSRIRRRFDGLALQDKSTWDALQDRLIAAMIRLNAAFRPHIEAIDDSQIESRDDLLRPPDKKEEKQ